MDGRPNFVSVNRSVCVEVRNGIHPSIHTRNDNPKGVDHIKGLKAAQAGVAEDHDKEKKKGQGGAHSI